MPKTAVVIGATGLIGAELVKNLLASNDIEKVITLSRKPLKQQSEKLESHVVDFEHLDDSKAFIQGDVFFSCLGTTKKQVGSISAQKQVDFVYQLQAAKIAAENGIPHYCLVSSSGANANSSSAYLRMKGELEDAVQQLGFKRLTIFKPSLLLGQRHHSRLGEELGAKILPTLCRLPGLKKYRPIQGSQVARKMLEVSLEDATGYCSYTLDEIF